MEDVVRHKVLICHNEPVPIYTNYSGRGTGESGPDIDLPSSEFSREIGVVKDSLSKSFGSVSGLSVDKDVAKAYSEIVALRPDLIFNLVESLEGHARYEFVMAGVFELTDVPYTGNTAQCLANCLDKAITKRILVGSGVETPRFQVFAPDTRFDAEDLGLNFPVIAKPLREDASIGISECSVVWDRGELEERAGFLFETYCQEVLVEEYIDGRELNVSVLEDRILPIGEIIFDGLPRDLPGIVTYEAKWVPSTVYFENTVPVCPAELDGRTSSEVEKMALTAYRAMGCRDYARVDIRLSTNGRPYVIEVNPNPDISTDSGFVRAASAAGISYDELLRRIAGLALDRRTVDGQRTVEIKPVR